MYHANHLTNSVVKHQILAVIEDFWKQNYLIFLIQDYSNGGLIMAKHLSPILAELFMDNLEKTNQYYYLKNKILYC